MQKIEKKTWPQYTDKMIDNVSQILCSGKVNQWTGTKVKDFEKKYSDYFGCKYSIAVSNGSVAIELCLRAIDLKQNDEVIITPRSFLASATSINICGGIPVFVDVDYKTQNITLENIKKGYSEKTKAIILVHLAGMPCDIEEIISWAKSNNIYVIEDCAQCHGAKYKNKYLGTFGDINAWSFCQDKIISTGGEGGMVTTNREDLFKKVWSFKDHGKNRDKMTNIGNTNQGYFKYFHDTIGSNYRMTEIQASIGIDSLDLLQNWVEIRRHNANLLSNCLSKYDFIKVLNYNQQYYCPYRCLNTDTYYHSYYKYYFYTNDNYLGYEQLRDIILQEFIKNDIVATQGSCSEIYNELCYGKNNNYRIAEECVNSKKIFKSCIMLQTDPTYTKEYMVHFIDKLENILNNISKKLLIIIGCGGHSKVISDIALDNKLYVLGYVDDNRENYEYRNIKQLGKLENLEKNKISKNCEIICGIGNINIRTEILEKFKNYEFKTLIHNSAIISPTVEIGYGTVIMPKAVINSSVKIENNSIINTNAIIEHDCVIGNNTHICPNTTLCGGVIIGDNTMIGAGTVIKNSTKDKIIKIGNNVTVGCGSVVLKSVNDYVTVYGKI
jgi:sugar O-acyltransferase (sialic acid O-acetyltransferase NeuD family)